MMANRNSSYVYGQDSIFDGENDGIDSMLSRDQRRTTNHRYDRQRRQVVPQSQRRQRSQSPIKGRSSAPYQQYHDPSSAQNYPISDRHKNTIHGQTLAAEGDYLDHMVHSVEQASRARDASLLAGSRIDAQTTSPARNNYNSRGGYNPDREDYDEEKQHSQLHSSFDYELDHHQYQRRMEGGGGDDDDDETSTDDDNSRFYLATANATHMRSVNANAQNGGALTTDGPSNVLAYILGGFGLCPPDTNGMNADSQVTHFQTAPKSNGNDNRARNASGGGLGNICLPDQEGLATDAQVRPFGDPASSTRNATSTMVQGGVKDNRKMTPMEQFRQHKLKLRQLKQQKQQTEQQGAFRHSQEEKMDDAQGLQETSAFPFNTSQFSDAKRKPLEQTGQADLEQGDLDLEEQLRVHLELQEEEEELLQQLEEEQKREQMEEEQKREQMEKDKQMDAVVDSGMDFCAIPGCPTSSGNHPLSPNALDKEKGPFEEGDDKNLFDDGEDQSRLEQIRQKKRSIEHQLETDHSNQNRIQVEDKSFQRRPISLRNKIIVTFLVFLFLSATILVTVSFFWPDLMPKLGSGGGT